MVRIKFGTYEDRVRGNYLLITNTVSRSLRGGIYEIFAEDLKLLDEHQIHYTIVPTPDPTTASDDEVGTSITIELQRRRRD